MKSLKWLLVFVFAVTLIGCASVPKKPDWITKGSGAFPGDPSTKVYGMGVYGPSPNKAAQIEGARMRARAEIATTLSTNVKRLAKDFIEEHKDWFNIQDTAGSDEFLSIVTKQVTDQTLVGSKQMDSWEDSKTGDLYMLYVVDLGNDFYGNYKQTLRRAISEKHRAVVVERMNDALQDLDKEVDKQRANEKELLGISK
ncbi:MAG: LPP20 family lipoprotein [Elusimicrobia bacterium]|nr:LPP20 family lipoprotein [Elusimicrobiota bacterium]